MRRRRTIPHEKRWVFQKKEVWKRGTQQHMTMQEMLDALHDFKKTVTFKVTGGWMRDEAKPAAKE